MYAVDSLGSNADNHSYAAAKQLISSAAEVYVLGMSRVGQSNFHLRDVFDRAQHGVTLHNSAPAEPAEKADWETIYNGCAVSFAGLRGRNFVDLLF